MAPGWTVLTPALALLAVVPPRPASSSGEGPVVTHCSPSPASYDVAFTSQTHVGDSQARASRTRATPVCELGAYPDQRAVGLLTGSEWLHDEPSAFAAMAIGAAPTQTCRLEGELTVQVLAFNHVSSASLQKQLFVVRTPCQPPLVTSLGPRKVQVWRSEPVTLGVAFEAAILCDISQGLSYTWSLRNSAGLGVALPPAVSTHRQTLAIPGYFLEPGNYTALAKVQVRGSVVYANHCVSVEVRARAPVSVISEGTHLLVARRPSATVVLRGSLSYDPDRPRATLRYHWKCTPASSPGRPCFTGPSPRSLHVGAPTVSFAADSLSRSYDQFLVTLVVSSEGRNSSEAQVFLSTRLDSALRFVHVAWVRFRALPVNWNDELSLRAACADCGDTAGLSYSWDLFVVNATEGSRAEVDFEAYYSDIEEAAPSGGRWPGITGQTVTIKPYSLSPGETYVLQASVASNHSFLGKAQLYLTVNRAPRDVACQVQPHQGLEAHTTFGVFCTSGAQPHSRGPAEPPPPVASLAVLVSIRVADGEGSQGRPCVVAVTVLPRFHGHHCPGEDLPSPGGPPPGRGGGGGSVCVTREGTFTRASVSAQLSFASARLILEFARTLLAPGLRAGGFVTDSGRMRELLLLLSGLLGATAREPSRDLDRLREEGVKAISDVLLVGRASPWAAGGHSRCGTFTCVCGRKHARSPSPALTLLSGGKGPLHEVVGPEPLRGKNETASSGGRVSAPRLSEKPTPSDFLVKRTYTWDERVVYIHVPGDLLTDATSGYLSLLDADFDRRPANPYLARAVNYTVRFQAARCLLWDTGEWASGGPCPQPGTSPERVSCSYDRLAAFAVARRSLNPSFEASDVSAFQRQPENLLPSIVIAVFTILYALSVTKSRRVDRHEKEKTGYVFLQEDTGPGHQLYAVVVDTGFRSPAHCSAKVYMVLCGENGRSGPRELHCPDRALFQRNSRTTFILSTPAPLGPLRKIRLWHDSRGPSPAWYVSRVMVGELLAGPGRSWLFPAECWLAADRQDGRVARELACLRQGLGFWKLPLGAGPPGVPLGALGSSFLCTLLASPGAQLLSLLFRRGEEASTPSGAQPRRPPRGMPSEAAQAPGGGSEGRAVPWWPRVPLPWLGSVAWAVCGTVSVACGLGTGLLGYRFSQTQCVQWLCLLTLSVACCVLVTQPLTIGLAALGFAWERKDDEHFFAASLHEATKALGAELEGLSRPRRPRSAGCDVPELEERVQPPDEGGRREPDRFCGLCRTMRLSTDDATDACAYALMLLLHLLIVHGRFSQDERALSHAVRDAFTRDACAYALMLLLHLLIVHGRFSQDERALSHAVRDAFTSHRHRHRRLHPVPAQFCQQPGAVGGTCHLMGSLVIRQLRGAPGRPRELPGPFSALAEDSFSPCCPKAGGPETPSVTDPEMQRGAPSGTGGCRLDCELGLGRTSQTVTGTESKPGLDLHVTKKDVPKLLQNLLEGPKAMDPNGPLQGRTQLKQAPRCPALSPGDGGSGPLAFLVLALVRLCSHLCGMAEKGVRGRWRKPGTWLELSVTGMGLVCCAASSHLATLAGEVTNQFHKGFFQEFVDLSHVASWNQGTRRLQGALSVLLTLKCAHLLGTRAAVAPCSFVTRHALPGILASGLAGTLLLAAQAHLRSLLLCSPAPASGTFADAFPRLLPRLPGGGHGGALPGPSENGGRAAALLCVTLLAGVSALWSGMLRGSFMTFARKRKPFQSQSLVQLRDAAACVWGTACTRPGQEGTEAREGHHPCLDEFACLLDELLLKVTGCSDSPRSPRPEQRPGAPLGARPEDQPSARASADPATGKLLPALSVFLALLSGQEQGKPIVSVQEYAASERRGQRPVRARPCHVVTVIKTVP
ncbi:polycystic kidney disease protein 1-like 1 [Pteropus vampyrus]|uniref:Polycystin-1-like protein 1 n=1 Tax=Pteropus vampyrus TaxID=132908 RepID=A0A6P3RGN7_PTEVA|nr:polycystic kidney disease protein 1-like 1 [Pteropus vampyrus]